MIQDDLRLGDIIADGDDGDIVLIGFPYDEGVARNSGRVGAKLGPKAFRQYLKRTGTVVNAEYDDLDLRKYLKISDGGNIAEDLSLEEAHHLLEQRISKIISMKKIPFIVGGGNDQSYPNASALLNHSAETKPIYVINIDAHLDVRPLKEGNKSHSGSPFRQLLEDQRFLQNPRSLLFFIDINRYFEREVQCEEENFHLDRFVEFACQGCQCSMEHVNYLNSKSPFTKIFWFNRIREHPKKYFEKLLEEVQEGDYDLFVSFDIDSIISASCPGVSAPATYGLTSEQALDLAYLAGKCNNLKLFDLSEFNPTIEEYRTGKLVTLIFYHFLLGKASQRKSFNDK